jgi:nucleotide-binding universal stress UspA family protein
MKTEAMLKSERPSRRITGEGQNPNLSPGERIQIENILVPVDLSEPSLKSVQYAITFGRHFGAKLTLLYVVPPMIYTPELPYPIPDPPDQTEQLQKELHEFRAARIPEDVKVDTVVCTEATPEGILSVAREYRSDLIIITTHGRTGLKRLFLGSTAERVVREAPCPVLVVHEQERDFIP